MIYLDHNATTPVDPAVCEAVLRVLRDPLLQANPSSVHVGGQRARAVVERGRQQIARALGVGSLQVTLTSGGTEANNLAIFGVARSLQAAGKPAGVVTSPLEHPSVRGAAARLRNEGLTVVEVEVNEQGHISPEQVAATVARHPDVGLVSLALCNHELGNLFEIKNVVSAVRETRSDVLVHTDAIQAFGKVAIDFPDLGVDLLSLSAHKVYGPKGVGALVHRRGLKIQSLFFGGHQERGRRPGTENPALVAGFGVAASCAMEHLEQRQRHVSELRSQLLRGLDAIPEIVVNGAKEANVGNTVNFSVPECEGQLLLINLDLEGIAVSTGAACSAGSLDPSHVLLALGVSEDLARSAIRVSFGRDNTAEDVQALLDVLPRAIAKVRGTA